MEDYELGGSGANDTDNNCKRTEGEESPEGDLQCS